MFSWNDKKDLDKGKGFSEIQCDYDKDRVFLKYAMVLRKSKGLRKLDIWFFIQALLVT